MNASVGASAFSMALGDLDEDGVLDAVTGNDAASSISVLLGTGTGGFGSLATFDAGLYPRSVALGDLNGDGHLDVVATNYLFAQGVAVLLGTGTGNFGPMSTVSVGDTPLSVTLGDMDGDGNLDIVTGNFSGGASVLPGKGTGSFEAMKKFGIGTNAQSKSVAVGDLNGDGCLDLVATSLYAKLTVLLNTGKTGACVSSLPTYPPAFWPSVVQVRPATATSSGFITNGVVIDERWVLAVGLDVDGMVASDLVVFDGNSCIPVTSIAFSLPPDPFPFDATDPATGNLALLGLGLPTSAPVASLGDPLNNHVGETLTMPWYTVPAPLLSVEVGTAVSNAEAASYWSGRSGHL